MYLYDIFFSLTIKYGMMITAVTNNPHTYLLFQEKNTCLVVPIYHCVYVSFSFCLAKVGFES